MPVDRRAAFQLGLLLLALPAQYFLTKYYGSSVSQRQNALQKIISTAVGFKNKYLSWKHWQKWCLTVITNIRANNLKFGEMADDLDDQGESPAVEVLKYRDQGGDFATSTEPRNPRPPEVKFRVGQVIKHKKWGYRGVIVGWDPVTKAPQDWIKAMHPPDKPKWRSQPNYAILVDTRDRPEPQATYVPQEQIDIITDIHHWKKIPNYSVLVDTRDRAPPQKTYVVEENIEIIANVRVIHPEIDEYFEGFDGAQYLARPWLKTVYPHD